MVYRRRVMRGVVVVVLALALTAQAAAATFVVNSTLDGDDKSADGLCRDASNKCTLRAAITEANRDPGADIIQFGITGTGTKTITLVSDPAGSTPPPLSILYPLTIDGTTQNGYAAGAPVIDIDGTSLGGNAFIVSSPGCEIRGLRIRQFLGAAVSVTGTGACVIRSNHFVNNRLGVEAYAGGAPMATTTIGGPLASDRNVFSANSTAISVSNGARGVRIIGNYIGTDVTGTLPADSQWYGIHVDNGSVEARNNVIAASSLGIALISTIAPSVIASNLIGTNAAGTSALGNSTGIYVVAGQTQILDNTIAANGSYGIYLTGSTCIGTEIRGNRIGTSVTGQALANSTGIWIDNNATASIIGGTQASERNVISGNSYGIVLSSSQTLFDLTSQTRDHLIVGNYIGVLADGTARPNQIGVWIGNAAKNRVEGNTISGNYSAGVVVAGFVAKYNSIRRNSIFGNGALGIDLENDNVTPNDSFDTDSGANDRQNYPLLATSSDDTTTWIGGTLHSSPTATFEIDLFSAPTCAIGGSAKQLIATTTVTTDSSGNAMLSMPFARMPDGTAITATTTAASGNTSELSTCVTTSACTPIEIFTPIAGGTVGTSYFHFLEAAFPSVIQRVEIFGGALPVGLTLLDTGEISGIPETSGVFSFTVRVTDTRRCTSTQTVTMTVCPRIAITPDSIGPLPQRTRVQLQLMATGGTPPYEFWVDNGPNPLPGLSLSSSGLLEGTPAFNGTFEFFVNVLDQASCLGAQGYSINVGCLPLNLRPNELPVGDLGAPYELQLTAGGGVPPYQFDVGTLPPGLEMSRDGLLVGIPRERGTTNVTVTVTDSIGCQRQETYTFVVDVSNPPGCDCASGGRPSSLVVIAFVVVVTLRRRRAAVTA